MESELTDCAAVIKPINRQTIHKICSGQVVLSLAIAVKELVENAIDASANNIEIKLKEYGLDSIDVLDNGTGVKEENFEALTLKHCTSKIQDFCDLESVNTMGFRGEALSSLSALCDLTVTTKHTTAEYATRIEYDHNGFIKTKVPSARCQGTTVTLTNIFSTLPVRRKEFVKNVKREFNKMCQLLYAYCLVCKSIRFSCTNSTNKGTKNIVAKTLGMNSVRDNIIAIFGGKQLSSVIAINVIEPNEDILAEYKLNQSHISMDFNFEFYISSAQHGNGRSAPDRQFYFINDRPCEPPKIMKLVNATYKQFNVNQYPFVYLNIMLAKTAIDVNVTPDKRMIFLQQENLILAYIKASLLEAFKHIPSTYNYQNLNVSHSILNCESTAITSSFKRRINDEDDEETETSFLKSFRNKFENCETKKQKVDRDKCIKEEEKSTLKQIKLHESEEFNITFHEDVVNEQSDELNDSTLDNQSENTDFDIQEYKETKTIPKTLEEIEEDADGTEGYEKPDEIKVQEKLICKYKDRKSNKKARTVVADDTLKSASKDPRRSVSWDVSLNDIQTQIANRKLNNQSFTSAIKFKSQISPSTNKEAESELQKHFNKQSFKEMEVIGQFNLAFIIAKLKNDLFIIDQHASDEKYNFEQLERTTVLENQKLVRPKPLELTAANESILIDNLEIFNKNGFEFDIVDTADATKKVFLKAIPLSKNYVFGKDDIDEMLFILKESNVTSCRPSRIQSMLASRACRKSVMVGRHLSNQEMTNILSHMGDIEQPWNCPHGRPTMRHLLNLNLITE